MSNFRLTMPNYLETSWNQLSRDGSFDRQDLATLKQAAQAQQGSKIQEALEIQTIDTLEQRLNSDPDGSLNLDKVQVHPQAQNLGHAIVEVSLLAETQAPAPASVRPVSSNAAPTTEPSRDEMIWAADIELKLKQKQAVPTEDIEKYKTICQRFLDSRKGKPAPSHSEMRFANSVQRKQLAGQTPTPDELLRFQDINARQLLHLQAALAQLPPITQAPTQAELDWAQNLKQLIQAKDYLPSIDDIAKFQRIAMAYQRFGAPQAQENPK